MHGKWGKNTSATAVTRCDGQRKRKQTTPLLLLPISADVCRGRTFKHFWSKKRVNHTFIRLTILIMLTSLHLGGIFRFIFLSGTTYTRQFPLKFHQRRHFYGKCFCCKNSSDGNLNFPWHFAKNFSLFRQPLLPFKKPFEQWVVLPPLQ